MEISMSHLIKNRTKNILIMTMGAVIYSAAIGMFLDPNALAPGGVTGVSVILSRLIPVETGTLILLMNIPILILGAWKFGYRVILSTIYCIAIISPMTNFFTIRFGAVTEDSFLAGLAGGVLLAVGMGMVFRAKATTGGIDIIIKIIRSKVPHLKTNNLFLLMDAVVVTCSALVFKDIDKALYAGMTVIITSLVMDVVLYGTDEAKLIHIISDKSEEIIKRLLVDLGIGVTYVRGVGAYSGKEKNVIMCVVKKQLSPKVEDIIKEEDPMAFMIVSNATEIYGEGYKNLFSEKI
ncbi:MAG: YitT family protein [Lachnospiraceae bacterium]|nr:YitT family protein [Lachnospiraceae bacterium]